MTNNTRNYNGSWTHRGFPIESRKSADSKNTEEKYESKIDHTNAICDLSFDKTAHERITRYGNPRKSRRRNIWLATAAAVLIICAAELKQRFQRHRQHNSLIGPRQNHTFLSTLPSENRRLLSLHEPALVGIIAGIGPSADARLSQFIAEMDNNRCETYNVTNTNASFQGFTSDACHTPYLLFSNPNIPNNNLANMGLGPPSLDALVESARFLHQAGVTKVAIACTAAHTWADEISAKARVPVLDLLELTARRVARDGHTHIGLLEVDGTIKAGRFDSVLRKYGIVASLPNEKDQSKVMKAVSAIKEGGEENIRNSRKVLIRTMRRLMETEEGITAMVLGCTDIAAVMNNEQINAELSPASLQIFNTLEILAEEIIRVSNEDGE